MAALRAVRRKFALLRGRIIKLVIGEDAFGLGLVKNSFCPTGPGGGVDPSCSPSTKEQSRIIERFPVLRSIKPPMVEVVEGASFNPSPNAIGLADPHAQLYGVYEHGIGHIVIAEDAPGGIDAAFRHEYGHHVQDNLRRHLDPQTGRLQSWQNTVRPYVGKDAPVVFSEYERLSHKEMYAESFSRYTAPNYVRGSLPRPIERYFDLALENAPTTNRFQFHSSPDKILAFQRWLRQQFDADLLGKPDEELWREFAEAGYRKGAGRAFDDVNKKRRWAPGQGDFYEGSRQGFLRSAFGRPESEDKLKLLASRSFTDLRNVTEDMSARMSRTLMDGLSRGANPRDLVDDLMEDMDVSQARAETIARTEIIRAHAEGQLDAMEKLGVEEVGIAVEWDTAKDGRVCPMCRPLQGVVLTVQEAHGLIPNHPNCRCSFIPANVGEDDSEQIRSKPEILKAFADADVDPPELDDERPKPLIEPTKNAFCPTGPGGGIDPSCSPGSGPSRDPVLTPNEKDVIDRWRSATWKIAAAEAGEQSGEEDYDIKHTFESALGKLPTASGSAYQSLRSKSLPPDVLKSLMTVGADLTLSRSLSTTKSLQYAKSYGEKRRHDLLIEYSNIMGRDISGVKGDDGISYRGEQEIIAQKGGAYRVSKISKSGGITHVLLDRIPTKNQQALDDEEYHFHRDQQEDAVEISNELREFSRLAANVFCPTGPGGGVDPSCSPTTTTEKLTEEEKASVLKYTEGHWFGINGRLRGEKGLTPSPEVDRQITAIDSAIAKSRITSDTTLYRGIFNKTLKSIKEGSIISDKAFMSTSTSRHHIDDFSKKRMVSLEIRVPKGSHGLYIDSLITAERAELARKQGGGPGTEKEVLLPRNTRLVVESVTFRVVDGKERTHIVAKLDQRDKKEPTANRFQRSMKNVEITEALREFSRSLAIKE